jgi:WD repeat-containing protein 1 (actin-interacting protein 1)
MQYGAVFVQGGTKILAVALDGTLTFLAPDTGAVIDQIRGHGRPIINVAATGDDSFITAGSDGRVISWSINSADGKITPKDGLAEHKVETFNTFSATANGGLAFGGGKCYAVDAPLKNIVKDPVASADANIPATVSATLGKDLIIAASRQQLVVLAAASGDKKAVQDLKVLNFGDCTAVAGSADGTQIAVAGNQTIVIFSYSEGTLTKKAEFKGGDNSPHRATVSALAFSPSGNLLASGDGSRMIGVFDLSKGESLYDDMIFHNGRVNSLAFYDEQSLYSGGGEGWVIYWDLANKNNRKIAKEAHQGGTTSLAKVGNYIVSTGFGGNILTWKP